MKNSTYKLLAVFFIGMMLFGCREQQTSYEPVEKPPDLVIPANGSIIYDEPITFKWLSVANADEYILVIMANQAIEKSISVTAESDVSTYEEQVSNLPENFYSWYVAASDGFQQVKPTPDNYYTFTREVNPSEEE